MEIAYDVYESPIGHIHIVVDEIGVKKIVLFEEDWQKYMEQNKYIKRNKEMCREAAEQLDEYFRGKRKKFQLPLSIEGTEFRKKVWNTLKDIPYGEVKNYLQIAKAIGNPKAVRAVGQANRANQLPIIIPCHRVIGKDGSLTGFAGNRISIKKFLLQLEGAKY
ncbi:MAG TPA: methylated-DNA--[protein]-cysteine S-methyltransferase [Tissierellales bacterium]|nr:methylated-DNA--[protein]-cysteine S-methyltransferase [Tissierellales bacterium]